MGKLCSLLKSGSNIRVLDAEDDYIRWADLFRVSRCIYLTAQVLAALFKDQALIT